MAARKTGSNESQALVIFATDVLPSFDGISIAWGILAADGYSTKALSVCQEASPAPNCPIGRPPSTTFDITLICDGILSEGLMNFVRDNNVLGGNSKF